MSDQPAPAPPAAPAGRLLTLVRRKQRPACVMLPGAGGGLEPYLRLAAFLGQKYNVYGVRTLGLEPAEAPETDVAQMAGSARQVLDQAGIVPDLVFGWSMGGTVAWEISARLATGGHLPDLVLVDTSPMHRPSTPAEDGAIEQRILEQLGQPARAEVIARVRATFRAQVAALATYEARTSYPGRVLLLLCTGDTYAGHRPTALARWRTLAPQLRTQDLPATHFGVFDADVMPQLSGAIGAFLGLDGGEPA